MTAKKSALKPLSKHSDSLREDAYEWIIAAISSFRIPTNSQISENSLAMELGISRTPVREALMRLESEGIIRRGAAGRFVVAMLTNKDVDEAMDLMILCDQYLFERAAMNMSDSSARALQESSKKMIEAAKYDDLDKWIENDNIFHETIMRAADNETIAEVSRLTRRRIQRFWARSILGTRDLEHCSREHFEIANFIIDRNLPAIRSTVEKHLAHVRANVLEIVNSMSPFFGLKGR